jgi:hypothetical protein
MMNQHQRRTSASSTGTTLDGVEGPFAHCMTSQLQLQLLTFPTGSSNVNDWLMEAGEPVSLQPVMQMTPAQSTAGEITVSSHHFTMMRAL